jgi:hypothetical protein
MAQSLISGRGKENVIIHPSHLYSVRKKAGSWAQIRGRPIMIFFTPIPIIGGPS